MPTAEVETREVKDTSLDLRLTYRNPAEFRKWWESNVIQRCISHLAAAYSGSPVLIGASGGNTLKVALHDGAGNALAYHAGSGSALKTTLCDSNGTVLTTSGGGLVTSPWQALGGTKAAVTLGGAAVALDMASASSRKVHITTSSTTGLALYDSDDGAAAADPVGVVCVYGGALQFNTSRRYIIFPAGAGVAHAVYTTS